MISITALVTGDHIAQQLRYDDDEAVDLIRAYSHAVLDMTDDDKQTLREAFQMSLCEADLSIIRKFGDLLRGL